MLYELPKQVGDMPAGTILLAGNIFDDDPYKQSRIVIYKSLDSGKTWSFLSEVDNGGPCTYDPSVTSTTTTVWEPFLNLSKDGSWFVIILMRDRKEMVFFKQFRLKLRLMVKIGVHYRMWQQ